MRIVFHALLIAAALVALPVPARPATLPPLGESSAGLRGLDATRRQALVLLVGMRVAGKSAALPRGDARSALRSMKVVSLENLFMASLARDAGWPAMQRYYTDAAALATRTIRGEARPPASVAEARELEARRRALMKQAFARANAAKIDPRDPRLNARADRIAAEIARRARTLATSSG